MLSAFNVQAQYTDVINSNRPGVSESAFAVGTNVLQVELGALNINNNHNTLQREAKGFGVDFSVRYGLFFEQLELTLDGFYQNDTQTINSTAIPVENKRANFRNLSVCAKYLVYDPYKTAEKKVNLLSYHANRRFKWRDLIPAVSVYVGANYDTENNPYTAPGIEGFSPKVMIATQHNFNGGWVFIMNFIKDRIGTDQSDFSYIITLTHSFHPKWAVFGETQGIKSDFYADNIFRVGGAYLWTKNFQLDTNMAFNAKDTPSIFNIALGASYRFDFHKDKTIDNGYSDNNKGGKSAKKERKEKRKKGKKKQDDFDN